MQIVIDWARENGFKRVEVIRGENQYWYNRAESVEQGSMRLKYDVTAKRSGFKFDPENEVYFFEI